MEVNTMPQRKKLPSIPDYINSGKNPQNHFIQKSNPLLSLSETDMSLAELKILDVYLDRIDSHDEEKRTVQFEKGEIEEMLGITRILKPDLEKRLRHLAQTVKIEDESKPKGFKLVSLFEEIDAWQDDDGLWQISLTCTNQAREYIFNIDNIGYLRYRLKNIISLTSRYSYVLYLWLEHNRFRHSWEIELNELKNLLRCTADTYNQFYRFNDLILKRCQKELLEKTDCRFSYTPIKRGRTVKSIRFTVETLPNLEIPIPKQIAIDDYWNDHIEFLRNACCLSNDSQPEFSRAEMKQIYEMIACIPEYKLPPDPTTGTNNIEFRRYHYLSICYAKMNRIEENKHINNRLAYLTKIIREEAGID